MDKGGGTYKHISVSTPVLLHAPEGAYYFAAFLAGLAFLAAFFTGVLVELELELELAFFALAAFLIGNANRITSFHY